MRRRIAVSMLLAFAAVLAAVTPTRGEPVDAETQQEMIRKAMEMMGPGPEHVRLTNLRGDWDVEVRTWPAPDQPPAVSTVRATNTVLLDGRFLSSTWKGSVMGMAVENLTILGFDRRSGEYTAVVFDTFGTYSVRASGTYDAARRTMTLLGAESASSSGPGHDFSFRLEFVDAGSYVWSLHFHDPTTSSGTGDFKMMELRFSRAPDAARPTGEGR